MYAKNSVFVAAFFGELLLNEKQKKQIVSLNNEVSEASIFILLLQKSSTIYHWIGFNPITPVSFFEFLHIK